MTYPFLLAAGAALLLGTVMLPQTAQAQDVPFTPPAPTPDVAPKFDRVPTDIKRWTTERAWQWYQGADWPCGFNYIPAHSISYTEMWMPYNFDAAKIDRELALAQGDGFNCARVVLPFVVWEHDPAAFKKRFSQFLEVASKRGIRVMPALFDDCVFGPIEQPIYGLQPVVVPGWYANGWTPSPGHAIVRDDTQWPRLQKYVTDMISTYKNDKRVWLWDLYNEPTNGGLGDVTAPLLNKVFDWARAVDPVQPLTCDVFGTARTSQLAYERSDIITFHNYDNGKSMQSTIDTLSFGGRPMICSEWLNRSAGSTVEDVLPVLARNNVGAIHWGLVNGRTQTNLRWGAKPGMETPTLWQHDLYRSQYTVESIPEGGYSFPAAYDDKVSKITPYKPAELKLFRDTIQQVKVGKRLMPEARRWLLPTAAEYDDSNIWSYITTQPAANWTATDFNDTDWKKGAAGFGTAVPGGFPGTVWNTPDIWIRRDFTLDSVPKQADLWAHHDEDVEIYLNGQKVITLSGWTSAYTRYAMNAQTLALLKPGRNIIAAHCHQTTGGQYVDVGISTAAK